MGLLERAKPLQELPTAKTLKVLVYGEPGVGKTTFAAQAPNPLLIDIEKGAKTLLTNPLFKNIPVVEWGNFKEIEDLFWELKRSKTPPYDTIIMDSISELQRLQLDEHMEMISKKENRSVLLPFQQDYKISTEQMRRIFLSYRDLPVNIVFTAHATTEKDEVEGTISTGPALTPKLRGTVFGMMDIVGYLGVEVKRDGSMIRSLQVTPTRRISAKNRLGLPGTIIDPTWAKLTGEQ